MAGMRKSPIEDAEVADLKCVGRQARGARDRYFRQGHGNCLSPTSHPGADRRSSHLPGATRKNWL
jgi:hypothetical protein